MDTAKQHWEILQGLDTDLANRVREFMVIGFDRSGVIVATEDGLGYWIGEMKFGSGKSKTTTKPIPLNIPELVHMAKGYFHILLLNKRGEIYSMGGNDCGQLGLGTEDDETHFSPQLIPSRQHKFLSVRCGRWNSLALTDDGKVCAWGSDYFDNVEGCRSNCFLSPRQFAELDPHRVIAIECGGSHSLALTDRGEVYGWGENDRGQLGDGSESYQPTPIQIPIPSPVRSMAAGVSHTLLLTQTGEVWACGDNGFGQLGLPTTTQFCTRLVKVEGLPSSISQIAAHYLTELSIAMTSYQRCFVWGRLRDEKLKQLDDSISTPRKLSPNYSTVESPLSSFSTHRNTPHSITIPVTPPSRLSTRMSRMFDNPAASPDVQFVVEQRTIHAHRCILSNYSDYFAGMFSERWMTPEEPIVKVTIPDHSYQVFHFFLRFIYTDFFELHSDLLPEMFELASKYLVPELQQLCLSQMRTTLTSATCCLYYPLTNRHSLLPELEDFQEDIVQFASTRMSEVTDSVSYQSMEQDLRNNLTNAVQNFQAINSTSKLFPTNFCDNLN